MIENEVSRGLYVCNGSVSTFTIPFKFFKNVDGAPKRYQIKVLLQKAGTNDTILLAENTDYSVSYDEETSSGSITTSIVYPNGDKIAVLRDVINTQEVDYDKNKPFPYDGTEYALDKITMSLQQLKEVGMRTLSIPATEESDPENLVKDIFDARDEAKQSAIESAEHAATSEEQAGIAGQHASDASDATQLAANYAGQSLQYKDEAAAILLQVEELLKQVEKLRRNWVFYVAGVADPNIGYDGSLNTFNVPQLMEYNTGSVYINGVYKTPKSEYNVEGSKVILTFDCEEGDFVAIAWQADVKDNPLYRHELDPDAHVKIQEKIADIYKKLGEVITSATVSSMISDSIKSHNASDSSHKDIRDLFGFKADKAFTYSTLDTLTKGLEALSNSVLTKDALTPYYKKTGGDISGSVQVVSPSDHALSFTKSGYENKGVLAVDKDKKVLLINKDADGEHGIEIWKDGSVYLRMRIVGINGFDLKRVLTEDDLANINKKISDIESRISALEAK